MSAGSCPWGRLEPAPRGPQAIPCLVSQSFLLGNQDAASGHTVGGWGSIPQGLGSMGCERLAGAPTHRCMSDRLRGGRTSGGSRTWGPCPCPHSCAGSLRFHSYRLLVRPRVHARVYKQNNKTISLLLLAISFKGSGRGVRVRDDESEAQASLDTEPLWAGGQNCSLPRVPWAGTENGLWVIWALDRAHSGCTRTVFVERKGLSGTILPFLGCKGHFKTASLDGPKVC